MTVRSLRALFEVLVTLLPTALVVPLYCVALAACGVFLLALMRERLHVHHSRIADSRASTAESLLRLERAEAARDDLAQQIQREAA